MDDVAFPSTERGWHLGIRPVSQLNTQPMVSPVNASRRLLTRKTIEYSLSRMSLMGHKQTFRAVDPMSALPPIADIDRGRLECPLIAISGHRRRQINSILSLSGISAFGTDGQSWRHFSNLFFYFKCWPHSPSGSDKRLCTRGRLVCLCLVAKTLERPRHSTPVLH